MNENYRYVITRVVKYDGYDKPTIITTDFKCRENALRTFNRLVDIWATEVSAECSTIYKKT